MPIGTDDGQQYDDELSHVLAQAAPKRVYITKDEGSPQGDAFKPPAEAPVQPAGEFKSEEGTQVAPTPQAFPEPPQEPLQGLGNLSIVNAVHGMMNPSFDEDKQMLSGFYDTVKNAFSLPGDVFAGKVPAGSQQEIEKAADLAGLMVTGPAPVAGKMADGTLGSFMGVKSKTINKDSLYKAQNMELDAAHADDIWAQTGTFRGADQRWRQEIPDNTAVLKDEAFDHTITPGLPAKEGGNGWTNISGTEDLHTVSLKDPIKKLGGSLTDIMNSLLDKDAHKPLQLDKVLDHPELYKAYPELRGINVKTLPSMLSPSGTTLGMMSGRDLYLRDNLHPDLARSVILHEVQHAIQDIEGFARGGNTKEFIAPYLQQAEKELESTKKEAMEKSQRELGTVPDVVEKYKDYIKMELKGEKLPSNVVNKLTEISKSHTEVYRRLSNIAQSEKLIEEHKAEAFESYQRLAGEVEARNVQTRMNMNRIQLQRQSPKQTQDRPTYSQIQR
jgi:ribosomal protein S8